MAGARTLLIVSQVYIPDPASVGQHMHDVAAEMVRRGWRVVVLASARGYEDHSTKYLSREHIDGVEVYRLPLSSFGKASIAARLVGGVTFLFLATLRALLSGRVERILISTSPPMAGIAGVFLSVIKRAELKYWAMDINPDQLVAVGTIAEKSIPAQIFDWMNRRLLIRSSDVIALDRFMLATLARKAPIGEKSAIIPPWPHIDQVDEPLPHAENRFRREHKLAGQFVVMYSGNLSLAHPITTILEASARMAERPDVLFLFVGGGLGRAEIEAFIEEHEPKNIKLLPYQPISTLRHSLSAADVHLVSMGDEMVGIVHPCKIYGAMAVGRPLLTLGPRSSHVSDILNQVDVGKQVEHGDVDATVAAIQEFLDLSEVDRRRMGERAQRAIRDRFSRSKLCGDFCDVIERSRR